MTATDSDSGESEAESGTALELQPPFITFIKTDRMNIVETITPEKDKQTPAYYAARAISYIMHPFLMLCYVVLLLLFGDPIMTFVPVRIKMYFSSVVVLNILIIPGLFIGLMKSLGYIGDFRLTDRRDRIIPLIITALSYIICAFMISHIYVAFLIKKFLIAGLACIITALVITMFWKISLHMIAAGGVLAMLVLINISGYGALYIPLVIGILLTGTLASARLYLGSHNIMQVGSGFITGFGITAAALLIT